MHLRCVGIRVPTKYIEGSFGVFFFTVLEKEVLLVSPSFLLLIKNIVSKLKDSCRKDWRALDSTSTQVEVVKIHISKYDMTIGLRIFL